MKKFVVMYRVPVEVMETWKKNTSPEEMKAQGKKLGADMGVWMEKHKASIVEMGHPLGKNTRVDMHGAKPMTNDLNYFQVVQAESADDVVAMFKDNPHVQTIPEAFLDIMEAPHMGL